MRDICIAIGEKMSLGLDFFLTGDIIQTIVVPSKSTLLVLGGIIVMRTDDLFPGQGNREKGG